MYVGSLGRGGYDSRPREKDKMTVEKAVKYRWQKFWTFVYQYLKIIRVTLEILLDENLLCDVWIDGDAQESLHWLSAGLILSLDLPL